MIRAVFFDLDGTLVQTEVLKARSYAESIAAITHNKVSREEVLEHFELLVGLSRNEVVKGLVERFRPGLVKHFPTGGSDEEIAARVLSVRLERYHAILSDSGLLSQHFCPFNLGVFQALSHDGYSLAIATMSHAKEAQWVIDAMGIGALVDVLITRDKVTQGKPNPEIYLKAMAHFQLMPEECLVIEDSVQGIQAAINAQIPVFAVTNDVTRRSVHQSGLLSQPFIVDNLGELRTRVYGFLDKTKT